MLVPYVRAQKLPVWQGNTENEVLIESKKNQIVLTHYFATWCKPCMEELPVFDSLSGLPLQNISIVFVSLDLKNSHALYKKIKHLHLPGKVYYLSPCNENINRISEHWNGTIPYTKMQIGTKESSLEGIQSVKCILQLIESYENIH